MDEVVDYIIDKVGTNSSDLQEIVIVDADMILRIANFAYNKGVSDTVNSRKNPRLV